MNQYEIIGEGIFNKENKEYYNPQTNPIGYTKREEFRRKLKDKNYKPYIKSNLARLDFGQELISKPKNPFGYTKDTYMSKFSKVDIIKMYLYVMDKEINEDENLLDEFKHITKISMILKIIENEKKLIDAKIINRVFQAY